MSQDQFNASCTDAAQLTRARAEISAGDDLVLRLKPMPIPQGRECYTLNHYHKNVVQQNLGNYLQEGLGGLRATHVWQMVPDVFSLDNPGENAAAGVVLPSGFGVPRDYVWQEHGYWHIGRSQVMFRKYAEREYYNNDMANQLKLNHMDMTFEPSWHCAPGEPKEGDRAIAKPGPCAGPLGTASGRSTLDWFPSLSLEAMHSILHAPVPELNAVPCTEYRSLLSIFSCGIPAPALQQAKPSKPAEQAKPSKPAEQAPAPREAIRGEAEDELGLGAMMAQTNKRRKKPPTEIAQ